LQKCIRGSLDGETLSEFQIDIGEVEKVMKALIKSLETGT
jgi:hypothetical protein